MKMLKTTAEELSWRPEVRSPLVLALIVLLGLQLVLALGLRLTAPEVTAFAPSTPLLPFSPAAVTRIRIDNAGDTAVVTLQRTAAGGWVLADVGDFPVASAKVEQLLATLAGLKRTLPVATSAALARFKLTENTYERRVTLESKDGVLVTLLLGDAPGFRRLWGRPATDAAVYELKLALSEVSNRREDWALVKDGAGK